MKPWANKSVKSAFRYETRLPLCLRWAPFMSISSCCTILSSCSFMFGPRRLSSFALSFRTASLLTASLLITEALFALSATRLLWRNLQSSLIWIPLLLQPIPCRLNVSWNLYPFPVLYCRWSYDIKKRVPEKLIIAVRWAFLLHSSNQPLSRVTDKKRNVQNNAFIILIHRSLTPSPFLL